MLLMIVVTSCSPQGLVEITNKQDVLVRFEYVYQKGDTKLYQLRLAGIPDAQHIPNAYEPVDGKNYLVRSQAIVSGDTVVSIAVPARDETEFKSFRLLKLDENIFQFQPGGRIWSDCTVKMRSAKDLPQDLSDEAAARSYVEGYNQAMAEFMPNYGARKLSCLADTYGGSGDQYIVLVKQVKQPPIKPFTTIKILLADERKETTIGETTYVLSVTNSGESNAAEVNFRSDFDQDTQLISVTPGQGGCNRARSGGDSTVCYLGPLATHKTALVEFKVKVHVTSGSDKPQRRTWEISGDAKENPDDLIWPVNVFRATPLTEH